MVVGAKKFGASSAETDGSAARPLGVAAARDQHYADSAAHRGRVLTIIAWLAVCVCAGFVVMQFATDTWDPVVTTITVGAALIFAIVPWLQRFGELVAPLTFVAAAYVAVFATCWTVGTGSGTQFFFLVAACLVVVVLGIDHIVLASCLAVIAAGLVIALQFLVPSNTGLRPAWTLSLGFVLTTIFAVLMLVVTVWYSLVDTARAEAAMDAEYDRTEALLANVLPASIAHRLKESEGPARSEGSDGGVIADKFDDASVLFADIVGFTKRASTTEPADLVRFLNRVYSTFDELGERYGLEKIKVSGDSYLVVSGVPRPRPDHVQALADFALDMAVAARGLKDQHGLPLRLRIGMACGPVVAGVVGSQRFFYDVWGDTVNVASRMESTASEERIQVTEDIYERLKDEFVLQERGHVAVKGKGIMRTWYLVGRKAGAVETCDLNADESHQARV